MFLSQVLFKSIIYLNGKLQPVAAVAQVYSFSAAALTTLLLSLGLSICCSFSYFFYRQALSNFLHCSLLLLSITCSFNTACPCILCHIG